MKKKVKLSSRGKRIAINVSIMVFLALAVVIGLSFTGDEVHAKNGQDKYGKEKNDVNEVFIPPAYSKYTDKQLTNTIFHTLVSNTPDITNAVTIFEVNNIFQKNLTIHTDLTQNKNKITTITYYYRGEVTHTTTETTYEYVEGECFPGNNSCTSVKTPNGTKNVEYTVTEWVETEIIPASYEGKMKVVGEYEKMTYGIDRASIDWIPKVKIKEAGKKNVYELKQVKWIWWNANWNKRYLINLNSSNNGTHLLEPTLINLTRYGVSCPTENNYSSIRMMANDTISIPWQFHSTNSSGEGWTIWFNANSTETTNSMVEYYLYCDNSLSAAGNTTIYSFYEIADGITDDDTFSQQWRPVIGSNENTRRAQDAETAGLTGTGHGNLMNISSAGNNGYSYANFTKNATNTDFYVTFLIRRPTTTAETSTVVGTANNKQGSYYAIDRVAGKHSQLNAIIQEYPTAYFQNVKLEYKDATDKFNYYISNDSITYTTKQGTPPLNAIVSYGFINTYIANTADYFYIDDWFISETNVSVFINQNNYSIGAAEVAPGSITIGNNTETPTSPATWDNSVFTFNATVRHYDNRTNISIVMFELDGVNHSVTNVSDGWQGINVTYEHAGSLDLGTHDYTWYANDTDGENATFSDTYVITEATNNNVSYTITPSTSVNAGESVTINCTASVGVPYLEFDTIQFHVLPQTFYPLTGTHNATCFVQSANYTSESNGTYVNVGTLIGGSAGCSDNYTYAFEGSFIVTNNTSTVINMSKIGGFNYRPDLQDVLIYDLDYYVNLSGADDLLIVNTTGELGNVVTVKFGNAFNNMEIPVWNGDLTVNETLTNITTVGNYTVLSFVDEVSQVSIIPPNMSSFYIDFVCSDGTKRHQFSPSITTYTWLFATNHTFQEARTNVVYSDDSFYVRSIQFDTQYSSRYVWLMNAQNQTVAKVTNQLYDYIGTFQEARMTITKTIGSAVRTIDQHDFDASGVHAWYGIVGHPYQYVISGDTETRSLGNIVVDLSDLDKNIVINGIVLEDVEVQGDIEFYSRFNNTTAILDVYYNDPYKRTNWVKLTVYNFTNSTLGGQIYMSNVTNNTALFSFLVPDVNGKYKAKLEFDHENQIGFKIFWFIIGVVASTGAFGSIQGSGYGLWAMSGGLLVMFGAILSFSKKFAPFGMIVAGIIGLMLTSMKIFATYLPVSVSVIMIAFGVIWWVRRSSDEPI